MNYFCTSLLKKLGGKRFILLKKDFRKKIVSYRRDFGNIFILIRNIPGKKLFLFKKDFRKQIPLYKRYFRTGFTEIRKIS